MNNSLSCLNFGTKKINGKKINKVNKNKKQFNNNNRRKYF